MTIITVSAVNITVDTDGAIDAGGHGYSPGNGPGAGVENPSGGSGGSHGGQGGRGSHVTYAGLAYDNVLEPIEFGSGGAGVVCMIITF